MLRKLFTVLTLLFAAGVANAQSSTSISASSITDAFEHPVPAAKLCFQPVDATGTATGFRVGSFQVVSTPVCGVVSNGVLQSGLAVVPNPTGFYYHITANNRTTNAVIRDYGMTQITGTSWTLDTYDPSLAVLPVTALTMGTVTTVPYGVGASCTLSGSSPVLLNCSIPQGAPGTSGGWTLPPFTGPGSTGFLSTTTVTNNVTNLLLQSQTFTSSPWTSANVTSAAPTLTANAATAPDSTTTATRVVLPAVSATGARSFVYQQVTSSQGIAIGEPFTASVYVKGSVGGEVIYIGVSDGSTAGVPQYATKIIATTSWQQYTLTYVTQTGTGAGTDYIYVGVDLTNTAETATAAETVYVWGAQLALGQYAGNYIPTTTAQVTQSQTTTLPTGIAFRNFATLTGYSGNPITSPTHGAYEGLGTSDPRIAPWGKSGSTYYALGACNPTGSTGMGWYNICEWSGPDPLHMTDSGAAVITNAAGTWKAQYVLHPSLAPACSIDTYCVYYSAEDASGVPSIGLAHASSLAGPWTDYGSNPVVTASTTGSQVTKVMLPSVIQIGSTLYMYTSIGCTSFCSDSIVYWTSPATDGKAWAYGGVALSPASSASWDHGFSKLDPEVYKNLDGFYEMAYTVYTGSQQKIGYAISADGKNFYAYQTGAIISQGSLAYPGSNAYVGDVTFFEDGAGVFFALYDQATLSTAGGNAASMTDF